MTAGQIVRVDFRHPLAGSGEVNKLGRPAIVVGAPPLFGGDLTFEIVVPLTRRPDFAFAGASLAIEPTRENGATELSYAISWNVQTVPHARIRETSARITAGQLAVIRAQVGAAIGV
ncbi:MAG: type II toxin-antitoxin system PemK/MazF family toxin [Vulcanimicrobiaceae bacterium]